MNLTAWRKSQQLTLSEAASRFGLEGANPARTLQRFETGERVPSALLISTIEQASGGEVTAQDLYETRLAWEKINLAAAVAE